jgi:hypothetical protein
VAWLLIPMAERWRSRLTLASMAALLACAIEAGEGFLFENPMEWRDVRYDALGIALGAAAVLLKSALSRSRTETLHPAASDK